MHKKQVIFHFVAVKVVYRTVLKCTCIFQCPFGYMYITVAHTNFTL